MWISKELVPFLDEVVTDDTIFPDHAILFARFRDFGKQAPLAIWRKPLPIAWDTVDVEQLQCGQVHANEKSDPTRVFQQVFASLEHGIHSRTSRSTTWPMHHSSTQCT